MIGSAMEEAGMSNVLRYLARCGAYAITMLLAAVWTVGGMELQTRPLFDLGKPLIGDAIIPDRPHDRYSVRDDRAVRPDAGRAEIHGRRVPARGAVQRRLPEDPFRFVRRRDARRGAAHLGDRNRRVIAAGPAARRRTAAAR